MYVKRRSGLKYICENGLHSHNTTGKWHWESPSAYFLWLTCYFFYGTSFDTNKLLLTFNDKNYLKNTIVANLGLIHLTTQNFKLTFVLTIVIVLTFVLLSCSTVPINTCLWDKDLYIQHIVCWLLCCFVMLLWTWCLSELSSAELRTLSEEVVGNSHVPEESVILSTDFRNSSHILSD